MDLSLKFKELTLLVTSYIRGEISCSKLQDFVWNIIDFFTDTPDDNLPKEIKIEPVFWYAVWQIQHLCDEAHEKNGTTKKELSKILLYLKGDISLPKDYFGLRP